MLKVCGKELSDMSRGSWGQMGKKSTEEKAIEQMN
jgi:hypothetical protein